MAELLSALRPLVVWMSNALELLNFIQHQLPPLLAWRSRREQQEVEKEEEELEENIGNEFHLCNAIKLINHSNFYLGKMGLLHVHGHFCIHRNSIFSTDVCSSLCSSILYV